MTKQHLKTAVKIALGVAVVFYVLRSKMVDLSP